MCEKQREISTEREGEGEIGSCWREVCTYDVYEYRYYESYNTVFTAAAAATAVWVVEMLNVALYCRTQVRS